MLRYLRITVTVVSLIACMLLTALWVRSYSRSDTISQRYTKAHAARLQHGFRYHEVVYTRIGSDNGIVFITRSLHSSRPLPPLDWRLRSTSPTRGPTATFHWRLSPDIRIQLPYPSVVFPVFAAAILAALPWIKWQFSLRTLLIVTTIIAAWLGLIVSIS